MKKISTIIVMVSFSLLARAQAIHPFNAVDIGAGLSVNTTTGDAETFRRTQSFQLNVNYNFTPYLNAIAEVQSGSLAGGDSLKTLSGRQFLNRFSALAFRGQAQLGQLLGNRSQKWAVLARDLYLGAGAGLIVNNITQINRTSNHFPDMANPGVNKSINLFVPVRIGYEFKIRDAYKDNKMKVDVAYTHNFVLGDDVDGYTTGRYKDAISQFSIGFKACLFGTKWYRQNL